MRLYTALLIGFFIFYNTSVIAQELTDEKEVELSKEDHDAISAQAVRTIHDLGEQIEVIVNKSYGTTRRNNAVDLALKLFSNPDTNIVQVTSTNREGFREIITRTYLNKMKLLPYSKVVISWYKVYLSSDLIKGVDGRYYGVATIQQKFEGYYNKEMGKYIDITKKHITIIVERENYYEGSTEKSRWTLKLGDIQVVETKSE